MQIRLTFFALGIVTSGVAGCGSESSNQSQPSTVQTGACQTGGSATGSAAPGCKECGLAQCNAELSNKGGSRWAEQIWGLDGACKAFNECTCSCLASGPQDPLSCATSACIGDMDSACQAAVKAADDCIGAKCATECR